MMSRGRKSSDICYSYEDTSPPRCFTPQSVSCASDRWPPMIPGTMPEKMFQCRVSPGFVANVRTPDKPTRSPRQNSLSQGAGIIVAGWMGPDS